MEDRRPREEAFKFMGPPVDARGLIIKKPLRLGKAGALVELLEEYTFFTPALLYLYGHFCDGPLIDCMYELRKDVPIYYWKFHRPLFRGLVTSAGDSDWNHALWAVPREDFQAIADFLVSLTFVLRENRTVMSFAEQHLRIIDPLVMDRCVVFQKEVPRFSVHVFGIVSNRFCAALVPGPSDLMDPPCLQFFGGDARLNAYADALATGANPLTGQDCNERR